MTTRPTPPAALIDDFEFLSTILACTRCAQPLTAVAGDLRCAGCGAVYPRLPATWDFVPASRTGSSELWEVWDQLQENGVASYVNDPTRNLGVGPRRDSSAFGRFCRMHGVVLDVGCGPQAWPSHFEEVGPEVKLIGVDPLVGDKPAGYAQFRALAERLPFRDAIFDHVVFATSFDHFVDPSVALVEAKRVCKRDGEIDVWLGEKKPGAPRLAVSPEWYTKLVKPAQAEDQFHLKRPSVEQLKELGERCGLVVVDEEFHVVDEWRRNYFCRMRHAA